MPEMMDSRLPNGAPKTRSVRGSVFLSSFAVVMGALVLIMQLLSTRHDRWWLLGTLAWSVLLAGWTYRLVVEYRRPPGDGRYMRETTRWLGIAYLVAGAAVALWLVSHHMYGFTIKP